MTSYHLSRGRVILPTIFLLTNAPRRGIIRIAMLLRNTTVKRLLVPFSAVFLLTLSCSRPQKIPERLFFDNYEVKELLLVTSKHRSTEGYVHVMKKPIERTYGLQDTLYLVYNRKDELVGFVTADRRTYRFSYVRRPYDVPGEPTRIPRKEYIGTWRTLALSVQKILELPYPVKVY